MKVAGSVAFFCFVCLFVFTPRIRVDYADADADDTYTWEVGSRVDLRRGPLICTHVLKIFCTSYMMTVRSM